MADYSSSSSSSQTEYSRTPSPEKRFIFNPELKQVTMISGEGLKNIFIQIDTEKCTKSHIEALLKTAGFIPEDCYVIQKSDHLLVTNIDNVPADVSNIPYINPPIFNQYLIYIVFERTIVFTNFCPPTTTIGELLLACKLFLEYQAIKADVLYYRNIAFSTNTKISEFAQRERLFLFIKDNKISPKPTGHINDPAGMPILKSGQNINILQINNQNINNDNSVIDNSANSGRISLQNKNNIQTKQEYNMLDDIDQNNNNSDYIYSSSTNKSSYVKQYLESQDLPNKRLELMEDTIFDKINFHDHREINAADWQAFRNLPTFSGNSNLRNNNLYSTESQLHSWIRTVARMAKSLSWPINVLQVCLIQIIVGDAKKLIGET